MTQPPFPPPPSAAYNEMQVGEIALSQVQHCSLGTCLALAVGWCGLRWPPSSRGRHSVRGAEWRERGGAAERGRAAVGKKGGKGRAAESEEASGCVGGGGKEEGQQRGVVRPRMGDLAGSRHQQPCVAIPQSGPFSPRADLTEGRAAMLSFAVLCGYTAGVSFF